MMWRVRGTHRGRPVEVHLEAATYRKAVKAGSDRLIVVHEVAMKTDAEADRAKAIAAWAKLAAQDPEPSQCICGGYFRNSIEQNRGACAQCAA